MLLHSSVAPSPDKGEESGRLSIRDGVMLEVLEQDGFAATR